MLYHCAQGNPWKLKWVIVLILQNILKNERKQKVEPKVYYILVKYRKKRSYDVLIDISENITLVQLMYSLGNVNDAISVFGYLIFDSNYNKALVLNRELLDMICAPSVGEEQSAKFETVFAAVRYIRFDAQLNNGQF